MLENVCFIQMHCCLDQNQRSGFLKNKKKRDIGINSWQVFQTTYFQEELILIRKELGTLYKPQGIFLIWL